MLNETVLSINKDVIEEESSIDENSFTTNNNTIKHNKIVRNYLNRSIDCTVYVEQSEGFKRCDENGDKLVYRLTKSLGGLKRVAKPSWINRNP